MARKFNMNPYAVGPGGGPARYFTEVEELTDLPEDIEILPADVAEERYMTKHRGAPSRIDESSHRAKYLKGTKKHIIAVRGLPIAGGQGAYAVGEYEDVKGRFMDAANLPRGQRTRRKHGAAGYSHDTRVFILGASGTAPFQITFVPQADMEGAVPGGYSEAAINQIAKMNLRAAAKKADIDREVGRLLQQGNYVGTKVGNGRWSWQKPLTEVSSLDFDLGDEGPSPAAAAPSGRAGKTSGAKGGARVPRVAVPDVDIDIEDLDYEI